MMNRYELYKFKKMELKSKAEKLEQLKKFSQSNIDSRKFDMERMPKKYLFDKIDSLHMYVDTILTNYIDAIEFMSEEEFSKFQKYQHEKYI